MCARRPRLPVSMTATSRTSALSAGRMQVVRSQFNHHLRRCGSTEPDHELSACLEVRIQMSSLSTRTHMLSASRLRGIAIHVRHFQPGVPLPIDLVNSLPSEGAGATMALSSAQRRIFAMSPTSERMCREPHLGAATSSFPWKPNPVSCLWASDVLQQFLPLTQHLSSQAL